jgi:hypothetical protein
MEGDVVWSLKWPLIYQRTITKAFKKYLDNIMKTFLNDFKVYSDMDSQSST